VQGLRWTWNQPLLGRRHARTSTPGLAPVDIPLAAVVLPISASWLNNLISGLNALTSFCGSSEYDTKCSRKDRDAKNGRLGDGEGDSCMESEKKVNSCLTRSSRQCRNDVYFAAPSSALICDVL